MSLPTPTDSPAAAPPGPVLVVHADTQFAERVVRALTNQGLRAESVADGELAIDRFVQSPACALVVDSELPGRDGAATIESIRWAPGGALVPVVLTAERPGGTKLSETGKRLGAATLEGSDARDPEVVAQLVRRVLGKNERATPPRDALTSPAIVVSHTSPTLSAVPIGTAGPVWDDESLPPVSTAATERSRRERETVAARMRAPAFGAQNPSDSESRPRAEESAPFVRGDDPSAEQEGDDVERRAADLTPGAATQSGRFAELAFPRLLARLAAQRATGALVVVAQDDERMRTTTGESPKKVVYFRNGVPVYVKSNLVRECLGQILVQSDTITPAMRNESVQRMRAGEGRQGEILLAMGALAPHELRLALEEQLRVKLFDLFSWDSGEFRFSSRVLPPPEVVTLELGLAEMVFEGVVRRIPPARLLGLLEPNAAAYVVPVTDRMTRFVRLDLVVEARAVLSAIDGTLRLRDLLALAGQRPGAAAQLVYSMECLGALRFSDLPVPSEAVGDRVIAQQGEDETPNEPIPAFRAPEPVRAPQASAAEAASRAALTSWDDETSDESSVPLGFRWNDELRPPIEPPAVTRAPALVPTAVVAPPRPARAPTPAPLPAQAVAPAPQRTPVAPAPQPTPVAPAPQPTPVAPAPQPTPVAPASRPAALTPAPQPTPVAPAPRRAPALTPAPQPAAKPPASVLQPAEDSAALAIDGAALDVRVERIAAAERHSRRGERALARGKHEDATTAFTRAVELVPDEGEFVARLAHSRLLAAPDDAVVRAAALAELERAVTLAPKQHLTHLLLGEARRLTGDAAGARRAYEAALALDPTCAEALAGLRSL